MLQHERGPPGRFVVAEIGIKDTTLAIGADPGNRVVVCFRVALFARFHGIQTDQDTKFGTIIAFVLINFVGKGKLFLFESLVYGMLGVFHEEGPLIVRSVRFVAGCRSAAVYLI